MCVTVSRKACQNRGPKAPCGLLSNPCSLGDEPPSPLSVAHGFAGMSVWETLTRLLAIGRAAPRHRTDLYQCTRSIHVKYAAGDQFIDRASQSLAKPQIARAPARSLSA